MSRDSGFGFHAHRQHSVLYSMLMMFRAMFLILTATANDYSDTGLDSVRSSGTVPSKLKSVPESPCTSIEIL